MDDILLAYIIRYEEVFLAVVAYHIVTGGASYSTSYTYFFDEMISRSTLSGAAYNENNSRVFTLLSEALKKFIHSTILRPFSRKRDKREAFTALIKHNLGSFKWEEEIEKVETVVMINQWNRRSSRLPLRKHITNHRISHNMTIRASYHIIYTPSNENTRFKRILKSTVSNGMTIIASVTAIRADNNKLADFDKASDFLITTAPPPQNIEAGSHNVSAFTTNTVRTGVELRYYKRDSFGRLSDEQKQELQSWSEKENKCKSTEGNHESRNDRDRRRGGGKGRDTNSNRGRPDRGRRNISSMQSQINETTKLIKTPSQAIASMTSNNDTTNSNKSALIRLFTGRN